MALIKTHVAQVIDNLPVFATLDDAIDFFRENIDTDKQDYALEEIGKFPKGGEFLVTLIDHEEVEKHISTKVASVISSMDPEDAPIEEIMELLKLNNAYIRNLGISILRDFGTAIKYYIVKFLIGNDRDLRIFAINVWGMLILQNLGIC